MAVEELGVEFISKGFATLQGQLDSVDKKIDGVANTSQKSGNTINNTLAVALGSILAKAAEVATQALLEVGRAAVGAFTDSVQKAADFESAMTTLSIAAKSTGLSFDDLHDAAIVVGADASLVGVSASGAAEAMTGLFKAGLSNTEVFGDLQGYLAGTAELGGALRASIDLAAATELDMVQASDLAAVALSTFGDELKTEEERAQFINSAMDNFVKSADASVASVTDLADALKNVGPTAASFGFSLEDTNNALAILSTRGISGAEAGTNLKSMMTNLMRPTDAVQNALKELNVSLFDTDGTMRSLPQIIDDFSIALSGMTQEQKLGYIQTLAGTYGMKAFSTLIEEGTVGWNEMAAATAAATGIQTQAEAKAATFQGRMEALEGVIETLQISIGEKFLPIATELAIWAADMAERYGPAITDAFGVLANVVSNLFDRIGELLSGSIGWRDFVNSDFEPVVESLINVFEIIGDVVKEIASRVMPFAVQAFEMFGKWFRTNAPAISKYIDSIGKTIEMLGGFVIAMWNITEPIFKALIDIILNVASFAMAMANEDWQAAWEAIKNIVFAAWEGIKNSFGELANWVAGWFGTSWADVQATWANNWEMFKQIASLAWQRVVESFESAKTSVQGALSSIESVASSAWNNVKNTISSVLGSTQKNVDTTLLGIENNWENTWNDVNTFIQTTLDEIDIFIREIITALFEWMGLEEDEMYMRWSQILSDMRDIANEVWTRIKEIVVTTMENIKSTIDEKINAAKTILSNAFTEMARIALEKATEIYTSVTEKIEAIGTWIKDNWDKIVKFGTDIIDGIVDGLEKAGHKIWDAIKSIIEAINLTVGPIWETIKKFGTDIMTGIKEGVEGAWSYLSEAISTVIENVGAAIKDTAGKIYKLAFDAGISIIQAMVDGVGEAAGLLAEAITKFIENIINAIRDALGGIVGGSSYNGSSVQSINDGQNNIPMLSSAANSVVNNYYNNNSNAYNLTTQSLVRPGALRLEFDAMSLAGR